MKKHVYNLEFITPSFLCGASQNRAELRAPSVRGELRWWFRALGGSAKEELGLFGGVQDGAVASKITVRIIRAQPKHEKFPYFGPMSDFGYLYFFASVSGEPKGIRIQKESYFAPGTRFAVELVERALLSGPDEERRLKDAVQAFVRLGGLGLRATRGCGAVVEHDQLLSRIEFREWVKTLPKTIFVGTVADEYFKDWKTCQEALGAFLRAFRRDAKLSGKQKSALGFSLGKERESSALKLRPVKLREGYLPVIVYTDMACSQASIEELVAKRIRPV